MLNLAILFQSVADGICIATLVAISLLHSQYSLTTNFVCIVAMSLIVYISYITVATVCVSINPLLVCTHLLQFAPMREMAEVLLVEVLPSTPSMLF